MILTINTVANERKTFPSPPRYGEEFSFITPLINAFFHFVKRFSLQTRVSSQSMEIEARLLPREKKAKCFLEGAFTINTFHNELLKQNLMLEMNEKALVEI